MTVAVGLRHPLRATARLGCAVACLAVLVSVDGRRAQAEEPATDGTARAGRIAQLAGTVSVHRADQTQWSAAVPERGFAPGEGLWTQPGASARLQLAGAAIELREQTQIELASLTPADAELRLVQGTVALAVPTLGRGETYQIDTPRGAVRLMLAGRFEIDAGAGDQPTRVTVLEGAAQVVGSESGLIVTAGQIGLVTGVDGGLSYAVQSALAAPEKAPETAEAPVLPGETPAAAPAEAVPADAATPAPETAPADR